MCILWLVEFMGFMGRSLTLMVGMIGGVYIAQKYDLPDISNIVESAFAKGKMIEQAYRKPKSSGSTTNTKDMDQA